MRSNGEAVGLAAERSAGTAQHNNETSRAKLCYVEFCTKRRIPDGTYGAAGGRGLKRPLLPDSDQRARGA